MIWRRPSDKSDSTVVGEAEAPDPRVISDAAAPKGRPTPKRRDAEQARKAARNGPAGDRSARKAERERMRADRARAREAMMSGDPRALPPRDQGPVKLFVRNFVDGRRTMSEVFVPFAIVVLVLGLAPNPEIKAAVMLAWIIVLVLTVLENGFLLFMLNRSLRQQWPEPGDRRGINFYAVMRNLQLRRLRIPPPQVRPGGKPVEPKRQRRRS